MRYSPKWMPLSQKVKARLEAAGERVFLFLTAMYLFYCFSGITTFGLTFPAEFEATLLWIMTVVALARLVLIGPRRREPWLGLALAAVCYLSHRTGSYRHLYYLAVMTLGFIGIDYRKILWTYLATVGSLLLATVLAALAGGIANIVYYRDGFRSSLGICYPTDLSAISLFALLALWAAWKKAPTPVMLAISLGYVALTAFVTRSRNSLVCGALLALLILAYWIGERQTSKDRLTRLVDWLLTLALPICAGAIILLVFVYSKNTPLAEKLNALLSDRLRLSLQAYRDHGLTAFGTPFDMMGNGYSVFPPSDYYFVDSSYMLILLRHGWVMLLALGAAWVYLTRRAIANGHRRLAMALGLIAFHSMLEHHFMEIGYNILLAMPLASIATQPEPKPLQRGRNTKRYIASGIVLALLCALMIFLPGFVTRLRTVFEAKGWHNGGQNAAPVLLIALCAVWTAIALAWSLYRIADRLVERRRPQLVPVLALGACLCLGVGGWLWSGGVVAQAQRDYAPNVEEDAAALECVLNSAKGGVYSDVVPDVYRRQYPGIRPTILPTEELARLDGATVLAMAAPEYNAFFQNDFRFAQISGIHGIYTNDPDAAEALAAAGFSVTDYYSTKVSVDLGCEAALNGLTVDERGVLLDGPLQSLNQGPYMDLFAGEYEVRFDLFLPERAGKDADKVCTLRVNTYWGENTLEVQPVYRGDFDADGRLTATLRFSAGYARATEFAVVAEDEPLYIGGLTVQKIGK